MKRLFLFFIAFSAAAVMTAGANAQVNNNPPEAGLYIAPKILYSYQKMSKHGSETDSTFGGALGIGYNFNNRYATFPLRFEFEYAMRMDSDMKQNGYKYQYSIDTAMLNGAIGINTGTKLTPYFVGGVGFAFIEADAKAPGDKHSKDNNNFAWSLGADLTYKLDTKKFLALEYRYIDFGTNKANNISHNLSAHEIMAVFRYKF